MTEMISSSNIIQILKKALDSVDPRLVDHGERVGYLVAKMLEARGGATEKQIVDCYVLGLLHDIGAYKTEEIGEMMRFESVDVWNHSIYGYLFLKTAGPMGNLADAVLCHHVNWNLLDQMPCEHRELANLLNLADRIETHLRVKGRPVRAEQLEPQRGTRFLGDLIDLFYQAEDRFHLQKHLTDGSFILDTERFMYQASYDMTTLIRYIQMVAYSIDFRSETTVTHTITTVSVSVELARLLEVSSYAKRQIYLGAYLHDLGKIVIPVEIIEKPGQLTPEEMEVMKTHVVYSGRIIRGFVSEGIYKIATRHHEKLDGSGYPLGLKADQLSLPEQIVAVADIISALYGRRSYKEAFPKERVLSILKSMAEDGKISRLVTSVAIEHYDEILLNTNRSCQDQIRRYRQIKGEYQRLLKELPLKTQNTQSKKPVNEETVS